MWEPVELNRSLPILKFCCSGSTGLNPTCRYFAREPRDLKLPVADEVITTPHDLWIAEWTFDSVHGYAVVKGTSDAILWGCKKILLEPETKVLRWKQFGLSGAERYEYL